MSKSKAEVPAISVVESEMAARVRDFDWASTPLGPIEKWPRALRIAAGICLNSRFPMFVWWGPDLINIYNDGYIPMLGARHPRALGRPAKPTWSDIWDVVGEQARIVMEEGRATFNDRVHLRMERHGYPEDTYFTWSYSPILDEERKVGGLFCAVTEETGRVLAERERDALLAQVQGERARLAEAFQQAPAFLAILRGPEHVFEYVNPSYEQLIGDRVLLGRTVREAVPEVADQGFFEILDRVYETGEPFVGREVKLTLRRGPDSMLQDAYIDFVYQPIREANASVSGVLAHGVDVTAHKLTENRDRFLLGLEDAMRAEKDPAGIIRMATRLLGEHLGVNRSLYAVVDPDGAGFSILGQYLHGVPGELGHVAFSSYRSDFPARMQADEPFVIDDVAAESGMADREQFIARQVGAVMAVPLRKAGRLAAIMAVHSAQRRSWQSVEILLLRHVANRCWDALEAASAGQRLRESLEAEQSARGEAERASRMKDEFLATLSHELRTPLNAILGWAHMLRRPELATRDILRGAEIIERNARAQSTIIQDLLDMSAIISGKVRLQMQPLEVATLVRASLDTARPTAEAKQVALLADVDALEQAKVVGDPDRLQQVLWNLLTNAIKFTPTGGSVRVTAAQDGDNVRIAVADTGEGISRDFLPFLFDRFRQADASTTRRHGGLGLGLSIVKNLAELHGGTVRAESEGQGRGATFTILLPRANAAGPKVDPRHVERRAGALAPIETDDAQLIAGKHILVVDDDADARELVRRLLEDSGAQVTVAGSSDEALARLREKTFDALVSDIGMPGEDGHALMRSIRSLAPDGNADIPAMALTAYARPEDRVKAIRAGFQMHASKPVEPSELLAMVAGLVRSRAPA